MEFLSSGKISMEKVYIHPIWADIHSHYMNNNLSLLYIYNIESGQEFVINIGNIDNHTTTLNNLTFEFGEAYTFDKKSLMSLIQFPNMYDAGLMKYLQINESLKENQTPCHSFFYRKFNRLKNVNNIIPTYKHIESIRKTKDEFLSFYNVDMVVDVKKFDNFYIKSLSHIEQNGLYTKEGLEWTQYNPYTITSRPSNTFGGVNYAALNKDDGSRSRFVSRFDGGKLVQFDYDAYHPRLISKLIGEPIPKTISGHQFLANLYGVSKDESKGITFRQLYGGVQIDYLHIPFFKKVSNFIDKLWIGFNQSGYIKTPMGRKMKRENLRDINQNKLFNYMLQATETELNMVVLSKLSEYLKDKKSKIVLYTYDSYLLDIHPSEMGLIKDIKILIDSDYITNIEVGDDYSNMNKKMENWYE
jgi:hypothetical protein